MKREILLCAVSGIMLGLSFPLAVHSGNLSSHIPSGILVFFALVPLFYALDSKGLNPFLSGLICGFFFYGIALFWVSIAMIVFGNISLAGSLGILLTLVLYMTVYFGMFALILSRVREVIPLSIAAPSLMVALELFRNYFLTGFPWANLGYAIFGFKNLIQICDITGVYGLTAVIVFVNVSVYEIVKHAAERRKYPLVKSLAPVLLILLCIVYGKIRINFIEGLSPNGEELRVSLIQGNVPQDQKWDRDYSNRIISKYMDLSLKAQRDMRARHGMETGLIVWPEASLPYSLDTGAGSLDFISGSGLSSNLIIGAGSYDGQGGKRQYFNSAFYLTSEGGIISFYHKIHLVPFSEHVLYEKYIPFLRKVIPPVAGDFVQGREIKLFTIENLRFGVLICFEAIFPELARAFVSNGADFLVNITNDAWFERTSGPYQHFEISAFRAVENRVYILRAANTGVSAVISPTGKTVSQTAIFEDAFINECLSVNRFTSVYTIIGDLFAYTCSLLTIASLIFGLAQRRRLRSQIKGA